MASVGQNQDMCRMLCYLQEIFGTIGARKRWDSGRVDPSSGRQ
jgi:hypothetical protein